VIAHRRRPARAVALPRLLAGAGGRHGTGRKEGLGFRLSAQALADVTGRKEAGIKKDAEVEGDLGAVAADARSKVRTMFPPAPLTVPGVS
jgi:DNA ligase N terminus